MTEEADHWNVLFLSIQDVRRRVCTVSACLARDVEFCTDPDRRTDLRLSAPSALKLEEIVGSLEAECRVGRALHLAPDG